MKQKSLLNRKFFKLRIGSMLYDRILNLENKGHVFYGYRKLTDAPNTKYFHFYKLDDDYEVSSHSPFADDHGIWLTVYDKSGELIG